jgi:ubiquinone/menaquinone biosynthesis C-methylase UbiE
MLRAGQAWPHRLLHRIRTVKRAIFSDSIYGLEWGDPEIVAPLKFIRDQYVLPYVNHNHYAVEIGPGGGRWTRYLLGFKRLYVVDYYAEMLDELQRRFRKPNMVFVKNNGTDFPGVETDSIDYLFSFDTFVHLDKPIIQMYLESIRAIVKPKANIMIHYSDKTKVMAQANRGFADNTPDEMRQMARRAGFQIVHEDLTTMWHSSIIHLTR